jgi:hypothetical protein
MVHVAIYGFVDVLIDLLVEMSSHALTVSVGKCGVHIHAKNCNQSPITNHQSPITNHQSPITNPRNTRGVRAGGAQNLFDTLTIFEDMSARTNEKWCISTSSR